MALLQRAVSVVPTPDGLRALVKEKPVDPAGVAGWGAAGVLDLDLLRTLGKARASNTARRGSIR